MTHVNHVVYKKVQGYLMVVSTPEEQHNAISNTKEFNGSYPVPCVFYSPYKPTEGIDPVCIPFQAVSKLQISVAGAKHLLCKFEIQSSYVGGSSSNSGLSQTMFFNFIGPDAEKNRTTIKQALPVFPVKLDSKEKPSSNSNDSTMPGISATPISAATMATTPTKATESAPSTFNRPSTAKTPSSGPVKSDTIDTTFMESSNWSARARERRVLRLRKDPELKQAYFDLVVSPPHLYTDMEFWRNYAPNDEEDDAQEEAAGPDQNFTSVSPTKPEQRPNAIPSPTTSRSNSSSLPKPTLASPTRPGSGPDPSSVASTTSGLTQTRSIESELSAGSGFIDLLTRSYSNGSLKLTLTPALKRQIDEEFPLVRIAFNSRVPSSMTPSAFWETFFRAQVSKLQKRMKEADEEKQKKRGPASKKPIKKVTGASSSSTTQTQESASKITAGKKGAKSSSSPAAELQQEQTWQERELLFFESLTDPTPTGLMNMVWKSKVSDAIQFDPTSSKSTSKSSLLMLADEERGVEVPTIRTAASAIEDPEGRGSDSVDSSASPAAHPPKDIDVKLDPIQLQQERIKKRMEQLTRGSKIGLPGQVSSIGANPGSGTISAEEMLFSALQEQSKLDRSEQSGGKGRLKSKSVGPASGATSSHDAFLSFLSSTSQSLERNNTAFESQAPADTIELLDGIIVEEGELDDASMSELRREKEKRNRHLQLIRKFNRHGHIIVSSSTSAEEMAAPPASAKAQVKSPDSKRSKALALKDGLNAGAIKMQIDEEGIGATQPPPLRSELSSEASIAKLVSAAPETKSSADDVEATNSMEGQEAHNTTSPLLALQRIRASIASRQLASMVPIEPSSEQVQAVVEEMQAWNPIAPVQSRRTVRPATRSRQVAPSIQSSSTNMDIDLSDIEALLQKSVQWRRHFWNIIERASTSSSSVSHAGTEQISFNGQEKLPAIVGKLQEILELITDMFSIFAPSVMNATFPSLPDRPATFKTVKELLESMKQHQSALSRCLELFTSLQS